MRSSLVATLSNVPLSKREKSDRSAEQGKRQTFNAFVSPYNNSFNMLPLLHADNCLSEDVLSIIPQARWIACVSDSLDHTFIASAVLTPLSLDRYTGSSRKYSVLS